MEMQIFLSELLESLQFDLPKEKVEIQRAVAGIGMFPAIDPEDVKKLTGAIDWILDNGHASA